MARRRQEIIARLKQEGVFDMQKDLQLPLFCQRIAVISSATAAGYGDFVNQLMDNGRGLQFTTRLFPAVMQGEQVEESVIQALNTIFSEADRWDCVVIIRGGGATSDLSGFDTLTLAENVAQFPLPVITGIGHDRDESILDMISFLRVKTPTAAAAFLVNHLSQVLDRVEQAGERLTRYVIQRLEVERLRLSRLTERIPTLFSLVRTRHEARLDQLQQRVATLLHQRMEQERQRLTLHHSSLLTSVDRRLMQERHRLELLEQRTSALDPFVLLRRGYSITLLDGHTVRSANDVPVGSLLETRLADGTLRSQTL
jgi:exodeoxyribonuclease VII large subunit